MRLPLGLSLALIMALSDGASASERTEVHLFQYGSTNTPEQMTAFRDFRNLLEEKLPQLAGELQAGPYKEILAKLALKPVLADGGSRLMTTNERIENLAKRRDYWRETGALGILYGRVKSANGSQLRIRSTFFWGDLRGPFPSETIVLELPFSSEVYDTTNDSHSVAILYALAIQIGGVCDVRGDAIDLLNQAQLRAAAIERDIPVLSEQLLEMIASAAQEIQIRCGG